MKQYEIKAFGRWWPLVRFENLDGQRLLVAECPFAGSFPEFCLGVHLAWRIVREVTKP